MYGLYSRDDDQHCPRHDGEWQLCPKCKAEGIARQVQAAHEASVARQRARLIVAPWREDVRAD